MSIRIFNWDFDEYIDFSRYKSLVYIKFGNDFNQKLSLPVPLFIKVFRIKCKL